MAKLLIDSDDEWTYFKHGDKVYRVSYYEQATIEDWNKMKGVQ